MVLVQDERVACSTDLVDYTDTKTYKQTINPRTKLFFSRTLDYYHTKYHIIPED